ncbi:MAG: PP2C family protein-serine/threonine phosphatase [Pyrinomonadaceae bacterium]
MDTDTHTDGARANAALTGVRLWLRRAMPRVAIAAAVLFAAWLLFSRTFLFGENSFGTLLEFITTLLVFITVVYYGFKVFRYLKQRLLWRVRRRLAITYLFVGLTPIVLLAMVGILSAMIGAGQAMSRIVAVSMSAGERQTLASAHALYDGASRLPPDAGNRVVQTWLDERAAQLQTILPGARVALWREANNSGGNQSLIGQTAPAQFVSAVGDKDTRGEETRGIDGEAIPLGAPLPAWLQNRAEWSGLSLAPPATESSGFYIAPAIRAVVRGKANDRFFAVLVTVPISRAFVRQLQESTGLRVQPVFARPGTRDSNKQNSGVQVTSGKDESARISANSDAAQNTKKNSVTDRFGEPLAVSNSYVAVLRATSWIDGAGKEFIAYSFPVSRQIVREQFWLGGGFGSVLRGLLIVLACFFLVLELLAVFTAAWMTRAVTGTVHKLYRATEFIKRGDFSHRVKVRSRDQLGELAVAFNDMSANIETLLQQRVAHERLEREVEIAAEVQAQLFPRSAPRLLNALIAGECRAARGVAGDYYDYIEIAPGLIALALGDVSGKGISASLVMSNLQAALRAQTTIMAERMRIVELAVAATAAASGSNNDGERHTLLADVIGDVDDQQAVAAIVGSVNEQLCRSTDSNRFATLFFAFYDDETHRLRYTNAGHNEPIVVRADKSVERLTTGGMMVGAFDFARYEEAPLTLTKGDMLLVFSDGISEAQNAEEEEYGEERLARFAVEHSHLSADEMRRAIFEEIDKWSGDMERGDDQTLMILKSKT